MLLMSDLSKYAVLAIMLLAISLAYGKGGRPASANGQSLSWTHIPLIALFAVAIGPIAVAALIELGYRSGLLQAPSSGHRLSTSIFQLSLEFAVMNWGFVALYAACRLSRNVRQARFAMWFCVAAMSLLNMPLFLLAPEMVSNVFDAGQGIGMVQAMLAMPLWFGPTPDFLDPTSGIGLLVFAPFAPLPLSGLIGWIAGHFIGWAAGSPEEEITPTESRK